jgi:protein-S-isoprenylcysteine O-methyltransferase Ste14
MASGPRNLVAAQNVSSRTEIMEIRPLLITVVPPLAFAAILYDTAAPPWDAMRIAGLVLVAFGITLLTIARFELGNSFSVTPQARALVTRGIYSRVRNPIYIFGTIAIAGLILWFRQPVLLLLVAILVPMQIARARAEARVLEQKFGDEYRAYRRNTWF